MWAFSVDVEGPEGSSLNFQSEQLVTVFMKSIFQSFFFDCFADVWCPLLVVNKRKL